MWSEICPDEAYASDGSWAQFETWEGSWAFSYENSGAETLADQTVRGPADYVHTIELRMVNVATPTSFFNTDTFGNRSPATDISETPETFFGDDYRFFDTDSGLSGSEIYRFTGKPKPNDRFVLQLSSLV